MYFHLFINLKGRLFRQKRKFLFQIWISLLIGFCHFQLPAQNLENLGQQKPLRLTGNFQLQSQFYRVQGIDPRQQPVYWAVSGSPTLHLYGVQIPFYLKSIGVEKNSLVGAAIAMSTLFSAISSFSYARIKGRFSFQTIFSVGFILMALGFLLISRSGSYGMVVLAMMLSGFGVGMMIPNTNIWVMKIAPSEIRGKEIGKLTMFWFFGQFISPIVTLPVLQHLSLASAFLVASGFLLLVSVCWFLFSLNSIRKAAG